MKKFPEMIAIEGIDGSGKGTQARLLTERLNAMGQASVTLSFPAYDKPFGKLVGAYLNGEYSSIDTAPVVPVSMLYAMNRREVMQNLYALKNAAGKGVNDVVVILDRYTGSNLAHQGARLPADRRDVYFELMDYTEHELLSLPRPSCTIFLDVDEATAHDNVAKKGERAYTDASHDLHESSTAYMAEVRSVYRALADKHGWRRIVCSSGGVMRSAEDIGHEVFSRAFL